MNYPLQSNVAHLAQAYLLAGGASRRMGRDKALLPLRGRPILVHLAEMLASSFSSVALLAPRDRYESFGFRIVPDLRANAGPLAAIEAALVDSHSNWNLILACDMPNVSSAWLRTLLSAADNADPENLCVASAESSEAPNPLCALWRRDALPLVQAALQRGDFRVRDLMPPLKAKILIPPDPKILANWNYPADWLAAAGEGNTNLDG